MAVAESGGATTVYRIFRQRHMTENPMAEADWWIRQVKRHCTIPDGEIRATAVWTDVDGGSILMVISGTKIIAREESHIPVIKQTTTLEGWLKM